jgi:hypothetical protein
MRRFSADNHDLDSGAVSQIAEQTHSFYVELESKKSLLNEIYEQNGIYDGFADRYYGEYVPDIDEIAQELTGEKKWQTLYVILSDVYSYAEDYSKVNTTTQYTDALLQHYYNDKNPLYQALVNVTKEKIENGLADEVVYGSDYEMREIAARLGVGLEVLVTDMNENVRCAVAQQGYGLNVLVSDPSPIVRAAVAEQGYGLDVLALDKNELVANKALSVMESQTPIFRYQQADNFINDYEKMQDFRELTKDEFLASYSYLTEDEYYATAYELSQRLAFFTVETSDRIMEQMLNQDIPIALEEYSRALKSAFEDPLTFFCDIETECKAKDLLALIDRNVPFDYSRIQFEEEIMCDTDTTDAYAPRATIDMQMWLTDRQLKDLVNMIDYSETALESRADDIKSCSFGDDITVNVYAVLSADIYKAETEPQNENVSVFVSITADVIEDGQSRTENCVWDIPVSDEDKLKLLAAMDDYSQRCDSISLQELLIEAKQESLSFVGEKYVSEHHVDGIMLAHEIAEFSYEFDPYSVSDNIKSYTDDPKTQYSAEVLAEFQKDPVTLFNAFVQFFDEEAQASFSDEQRSRFAALVDMFEHYVGELYHGFEYNSYEISNISPSSTDYIFDCPDGVIQEYINRVPPSYEGLGSSKVDVVRHADDVEINVKVSLGEDKTQIMLQKDGWSYSSSEYNIPLSDAEYKQISELTASLEHERLQPPKTWTDIMNETLETAHVAIYNTFDMLERTRLSLPELNTLFEGLLDMEDSTMFNEPISDYRYVMDLPALNQLVNDYPVCVIDKLYTGDEKYNHPVGFAQNDPMQIMEIIENRLADYYERDLKNELQAACLDVNVDALQNYQDYIDLGNRLMNGTTEEQSFYMEHKQDFQMFDLVASHIDEVDMSKVIIRVSASHGERSDYRIRLPEDFER